MERTSESSLAGGEYTIQDTKEQRYIKDVHPYSNDLSSLSSLNFVNPATYNNIIRNKLGLFEVVDVFFDCSLKSGRPTVSMSGTRSRFGKTRTYLGNGKKSKSPSCFVASLPKFFSTIPLASEFVNVNMPHPVNISFRSSGSRTSHRHYQCAWLRRFHWYREAALR